jgi:hypothetical protein
VVTKVLLAGLVALVVLAAAPRAFAADPPVANCTLPNQGNTATSCAGWHTDTVSVTWTTDPTATLDGCGPQTQSDDTAGKTYTCTEHFAGNPETTPDLQASVTLQVDKTPPSVTAGAPARPPDTADGWYNHPVAFAFQGTDNLTPNPVCSAPTYSGPDSATASIGGSCTDAALLSSPLLALPLKYDATPPVVAGALPSRPADFNGWYNHPVSFTFFGADATSGLAGCATTTYAGPTDGTAAVEGSCTDRAGNRAASSASLRYDSTPPAPVNLTIKPRNGALLLTWSSAPDVSSVVITRSQQGSSAGPATLYSGTGNSVLDKGLENGTKYRYTITGIDQAGNSSSQTVPAVPTGSSLLPAPGARVTSAPGLTWKKIKRARYYNVQLFRGRHKVLSAWPGTNSFQIRTRWVYRGKRYTLTPGHYRWYVWPGLGKRSRHHYGRLIGRSSFRFVAA